MQKRDWIVKRGGLRNYSSLFPAFEKFSTRVFIRLVFRCWILTPVCKPPSSFTPAILTVPYCDCLNILFIFLIFKEKEVLPKFVFIIYIKHLWNLLYFLSTFYFAMNDWHHLWLTVFSLKMVNKKFSGLSNVWTLPHRLLYKSKWEFAVLNYRPHVSIKHEHMV